MLQNRVDPFGNIIKTRATGSWMGNRGVLHDEHQTLIRPFKLNAWITCKLEFKERWRKVMTPDRWTELFFLDEATSFAAGHRPCFECRRPDALRFKWFWLQGNHEYNFDEKTPIREIDKILHKERMDRDKSKITFIENQPNLPNGAFVLFEGLPFLVLDGLILRWSPFGYEKGMPIPAMDKITVLTPRSIVNMFRAGYMPQMSAKTTRK
jgi:hypothetical protein